MKKIERIISTFDTGIESIVQKTISEEEFKQLVKDMPNKIKDDLINRLQENMKKGIKNAFVLRTELGIIGMEASDDEHILIKTFFFRHNESAYDFTFEEESDGTRRLFELINILLDTDGDSVYIIDELDRSLHPNLTYKYLNTYLEEHKKNNIQLIFTTHESNIMTQELVRRDEVWFVERNFQGESSIYPLRDFEERYDKSLSKAYLEGRYGGLPIFKDTISMINKVR